MSEEQNQAEIEVYQTNRFEKALDKLPQQFGAVVEDEIDAIVENPELGELKKGDLSYLRVHKFKLNNQLMLLRYSWNQDQLIIHLLSLGSHENFYQQQKKMRKSDLKLIR
ncbi:type II toxin-antitoxin system RelE/ParE family toxin [Dickeya dadantii]|uniref:type II toxin-antitoxin system RelE/ParE family toxin n=1 Tax=Dickeya dadantii TaxID=204038 RepID=UPI00149594D2|nr:type II toxin-antitoxin system RelE/ParE family toxin [Dickeya dadantii]NPE61423.1 type II toxin-antitoxin system RelE/ParE family toxin [Dickeya dadantii]NPE72700.1 type II toxin-antitoxin system RelE/ParE family toxin [Dickeya dadantii]